jgi:hypothetical protein
MADVGLGPAVIRGFEAEHIVSAAVPTAIGTIVKPLAATGALARRRERIGGAAALFAVRVARRIARVGPAARLRAE